VAEQLKGGKTDDATDLPNFLWLIRDHQLKMVFSCLKKKAVLKKR
jgi:hypothetical protein